MVAADEIWKAIYQRADVVCVNPDAFTLGQLLWIVCGDGDECEIG